MVGKALPTGHDVGVRIYAVIPARGRSKGVPGKNLRRVAGRPLVERAVDAASRAASVDLVVVSTDDPDIAEVARTAGAEIVDRPVELASDAASSESAVLHALDDLAGRGLPEPDVVVLVQCTSPFTTPDDVDGVVALVAKGEADSAFTAARTHGFLWRTGPDGAVAVNHDASVRPRRQDREPEYVETGAVYAMRTAGLRGCGHRFFGRVELFDVPPSRAVEIDEPADLTRAEHTAGELARDDRRARLPARIAGLALDFDGVLTDNRVMTAHDGSEYVVSDRGDGLGIERLRQQGIPMIVLSKERHPVVAARCAKLGLACTQGLDDKAGALRTWMHELELDPASVVFVGNDVNDLECFRIAGTAVVPVDAHPDAIAAADIVLARPGGRGAVRELADLIAERHGGVA
jgi:N-acylneuraminate cytidylyltransferase